MVELLRHPDARDWYEVKRRALVTIGKKQFSPPTDEWKHKMLEARHSPIRYLMTSTFLRTGHLPLTSGWPSMQTNSVLLPPRAKPVSTLHSA